ncbi:hypothetical protein D9758_008047 [Tetrapyrgos nigripes]|uniref:Nitrogen regulatory protein areA GATA-like domain-containing protein n=1 Tax=Tetrapyrgos nigripes TaxID=182062 RepID=A0A8H5D0E7_9AGAR|nr:hypothetical protein D9758_008047 [Tetrapyrgos nigripes]
MSNYLPVLLVSVSTNAVPDDSSLSTLPRGQVDYLSHNWEEEDVWRSWRNMTRQKNEIANGVRLENASWRTWWKQRNKLKTVSPETLNWLKDSDVTWLYGPLHTAVDWSPPPRPPPIETEHKPSSTTDRLDLSVPKHKSILKYRSISELLTSDLHSPHFSPAESENEHDDAGRSLQARQQAAEDSAEVEAENSSSLPDRPPLSYTKSDTHITRWGPSRLFRKDSPPRVGPPEDSSSLLLPTNGHSTTSGDHSSSNSPSPSPQAGHSDLSLTSSGTQPNKKKHITFNTFVEQCIAIEKPKPKGKLSALGLGGFEEDDEWYEGVDTPDDDGYDEDGEDGSFDHDADWGLDECAVGTDSDSDCNNAEEILKPDEEEDDDGVIEMRSRKHGPKRSKTSSDSSSTSTNSSADSYSSSSASSKPYSTIPRKSILINSRRRRRSDAARASLPRRKSSSSNHSPSEKDSHHVTIAPIAPTVLKTGNSSWDGFGVHSPYQPGGASSWMESFGDEGYSDDGIGSKAYAVINNKLDSDNDGINKPVELVYVPPTGRYGGSGYGSRLGSPSNASPKAGASNVDELEESKTQKDSDANNVVEESVENGDRVYRHHQSYFSLDDVHPESAGSSVPIVVRTPPVVDRGGGSDDEAEEDAYDYFAGPDLGGDYATKRTSLRRKHRASSKTDPASGEGLLRSSSSSSMSLENDPDREMRHRYRDEERQSRSRSRSRSRTPSPNYVPTSTTAAISVPGRNTSPSQQPSGSSSLLSPPGRGSPQIPSSSTTARGRSSTRTSSSSLSDRERSNHSSPLGSLSPEGSAIGIAYGAYANGRGGGDRERDRPGDKELGRGRRDGERGRDRTGRSLSHSLSPDVVGSPTSPSLSPSRSVLLGDGNVQGSASQTPSSNISSSPSSSSTVLPAQSDNSRQQGPAPSSTAPTVPIPLEVRDDNEMTTISTHTPANSPVVSMSSIAHRIAEMDGKNQTQTESKLPSSPLSPTGPQLSYPKVSTVQPSIPSPSSPGGHTRTASGSLRSTGSEGEDGIVNKAMGVVSSAGAYLGFWNNGSGTMSV